jgi:hypothetical protein
MLDADDRFDISAHPGAHDLSATGQSLGATSTSTRLETQRRLRRVSATRANKPTLVTRTALAM